MTTTEQTAGTFTVTTISGATREIPANLVDAVVGLDAEGRIVVDHFGALDDPKKGAFLFGLTLCCNASDTGTDDGVYCRGCYGCKPNADEGDYLFAWETDGVYGYPDFDPIDPGRFVVRKDAVHSYYGLWDNDAASWNDGIHGDATYAAGVPFWSSADRAREVAVEMNNEQALLIRSRMEF